MKKILLFLTLSFIYLLGNNLEVKAANDSFYEAEFLNNIYMVRYDKSTNTKYYQKARMYKRASDGKIAYCLQPFFTFNEENNIYETVGSLPNITMDTLNTLTDLIGFGYGYKNHTDEKWYAITQLLIWKTVEPQNDFYFTDTLNGNKIEPYNKEINQIYNLINESNKTPSFNNQTFYGIVNRPLIISDTNNIIDYYAKDTPSDTIINNGQLIINKNTPGCYDEYFTRYYNHDNSPVLFYYNPNNQSLATVGSPNNKKAKISYCFNELKLKIKKIDTNTKDKTSLGEASLKNTIFTLYNKNMEKITDITLDENMEAEINSSNYDLTYDTYYLKETKSGTGYLPNDEIYEIKFTAEKPTVELTIENKVIEKEIIIKKLYGDGKLMLTEPNITFEIYDINNKLVKTITTNQNGLAKIILPYGHYKIVQVNTTEGYTKIKPFSIFINDINKDYYYTINDYKIPKEQIPNETISIEVPNTSTENNNYQLLSLILPAYLIAKKKFN